MEDPTTANVNVLDDLYPPPPKQMAYMADEPLPDDIEGEYPDAEKLETEWLNGPDISPVEVEIEPEDPDAKLVSIMIPSVGRETRQKPVLDDNGQPALHPMTGQRQTAKFVYGSINGEPFEVECDRQVQVPYNIAKLLVG